MVVLAVLPDVVLSVVPVVVVTVVVDAEVVDAGVVVDPINSTLCTVVETQCSIHLEKCTTEFTAGFLISREKKLQVAQ